MERRAGDAFQLARAQSTLAALSMATTRIGLIATASTTYTEPCNLARQFASLDHISCGRVGWNIVTSRSHQAGSNYNNAQFAHAERYERAEEYMAVVNALWDSWSDDASSTIGPAASMPTRRGSGLSIMRAPIIRSRGH